MGYSNFGDENIHQFLKTVNFFHRFQNGEQSGENIGEENDEYFENFFHRFCSNHRQSSKTMSNGYIDSTADRQNDVLSKGVIDVSICSLMLSI